MSWLRLYTSTLNDPKVQKLPAELFKAWINLLCFAKDNGGQLAELPAVAFGLRITEKEASQVIEKLVKVGLLDKTKRGVTPHNWDKRQYVSDVSTERVQRFRKRHETVSGNAPEQNRAEQSRDRTEKSPPTPQGGDAEFEVFWGLYPKKTAKPTAHRAFRAALKKASAVEILNGIKRYAQQRKGEDPQFTKNPATWLNGCCWADLIDPAAKRNKRNGSDDEFVGLGGMPLRELT